VIAELAKKTNARMREVTAEENGACAIVKKKGCGTPPSDGGDMPS
jgi:hypothetical protein